MDEGLKIQSLLKKYTKREDVIKLLFLVQSTYGYLPLEILKIIAKETKVFPSELFGIATFYAHFRFTPQGKNIIKVCHGTACHVSGAEKISNALEDILKIKDKETTRDGLFSLERVACLGCCSLAPCLMINDKAYGRLKPKDIEGIITKAKKPKIGSSKICKKSGLKDIIKEIKK